MLKLLLLKPAAVNFFCSYCLTIIRGHGREYLSNATGLALRQSTGENTCQVPLANTTQSRIIGAVRRAHSQLWGTIIPVCSLYSARKSDRIFGTPAIV